jgi:hypothetical protein
VKQRVSPVAFGLLALAALTAAGVVLVTWARGDDTPAQPTREASPEIETQASMRPRPVLFGDTVRASVDVVLDSERIDPESVRVAADFTPWEVVGRPEQRVASAGKRAYVRTTFVLRCLTGACVPSGNFSVYEFDPGRVSFARRSSRLADESSIAVPLPSVRVYSRLTEAAPVEGPRSSAPWQADLLSLPRPSFRMAPGVLITVLVLAALVAALGAVALAYAAWPRAALAPPPEPEPEPPPEPALSPLEQALVLLEKAVRVNGAADQRRALELVAEELEREAWGDPTLAHSARTLAWSEGVPPVDQTAELAARVRSVLEETHEGRDNGAGDAT